jgi:large subunit ribosomal protein L3
MLNTLLGIKGEMGASYVEGTRVPLTKVKVGPCVVTQIKSKDKDGYDAVQIGFGEKRIKNINKPQKGHLKSAIKGKFAPRYLKEVKVDDISGYKIGDEIKLNDVFKKGDQVTVSGISKGKGFAGVVKRWHFAGGPKTHGQSDRQRAPGSIGQGTTPGRVLKGKHMAGRMGGEKKTIKNLIVVNVLSEEESLLISGSVPGSKGGILTVVKTGSGKLEELVEETPQVQVHEGEGEESQSSSPSEDKNQAEKRIEEKEEKHGNEDSGTNT